MVGEPFMESIAHAVAAVGGRIYLSGGFNGVALGRMVALSVPSNPCLVFPNPDACNGSNASCTWCHGSCVSADAAERCERRVSGEQGAKVLRKQAGIES